jgi:hypothetical protein
MKKKETIEETFQTFVTNFLALFSVMSIDYIAPYFMGSPSPLNN